MFKWVGYIFQFVNLKRVPLFGRGERKFRLENHVFAEKHKNEGRNHFADRENNIADERNNFVGLQCHFADLSEQPDGYIFMAECRGWPGSIGF